MAQSLSASNVVDMQPERAFTNDEENLLDWRIRQAFEAFEEYDRQYPEGPPDDAPPPHGDAGRSESKGRSDRFADLFDGVQTASDIAATRFPDLPQFVEGWLVPGLTLLIAKPKKGKSWLTLNWAVAVAQGTPAMGEVPTKRAGVLYLALEYSPRRLQTRMQALGAGFPSALRFHTTWKRGENGEQALEAWLDMHPDVRFVVIDVLAKFKNGKVSGGSAYDSDYAALEGLRRLAQRRQIAILVIHHSRKADSDDPVDVASGTLAITGASDHFIVLQPADCVGGEDGREMIGSLKLQGRDLPDAYADLAFKDGRWSWRGGAAPQEKHTRRDRMIWDLHTKDPEMSNREIARRVQEAGMSCTEGTVRNVLKRGCKD